MLYTPDPKPEEKPKDFYIKALTATACRCGRKKQRGMALCSKDWRQLPTVLRHDLYKKMKAGFEEAYEAACDFLDNPDQ